MLARSPGSSGVRRAVQERKVGAGDAGLVGEVDDHTAVEKVGAGTFAHGAVVVVELGVERVRRDLAVFAAQVTGLAGLRLGSVTDRLLTADEGVEMG